LKTGFFVIKKPFPPSTRGEGFLVNALTQVLNGIKNI